MIENLKEIVDYGVIGILLFMSVVSFGVFIERLSKYASIKIERYTSRSALEYDLIKRIDIISTIGANAPYIGLLGTVLAIIVTFYSLGESGIDNSSELMKNLALALKATAVGLVVAIPSVIFYNVLAKKVDMLLLRWDIENDA